MAMESPVWALLAANPALTAIVPASAIFKSGYAGEKTLDRYITIQEIGTAPQNYIADRPGIDQFRPTVKVMSRDEGECKRIAEIVRDTLELDGHCIVADGPEFDAEAKVFMHLSDWHFYVNR